MIQSDGVEWLSQRYVAEIASGTFGQHPDALCKDLQATRRCPVCIQQPSQPPGSFVLLEVLDVPLKLVRGFLALVRVGESFGKGPDLLLGLWIGCDQCVGVGQVPGLQLLTDEAYQGLAATGGAHGL